MNSNIPSPLESIAKLFSIFSKVSRSAASGQHHLSSFYANLPTLQKNPLQELTRSPLPVKDTLVHLRFCVPIDLPTLVNLTGSQSASQARERFAFFVYFQEIAICCLSLDTLTATSMDQFMMVLSLCTDPVHRETVDFCFRTLFDTALDRRS
jgi:hypothetical protein